MIIRVPGIVYWMCEELKRNGGAIKFESVFQSVFYIIQSVQFFLLFPDYSFDFCV